MPLPQCLTLTAHCGIIRVMQIVTPISAARADELKHRADLIREIADRYEAGDICEIAIVLNDRTECVFESHGFFDDRWRILGALEYAKSCV